MSYTAKAQVGGKLAQIGSRLIDGAAAKMADEFFARFAERVAPAAAATAPSEAVAPPAPRGFARYIALALLVAIVAWLALKGFKW